MGASFDSVEDQAAFAEGQNFPYTLLADPDKAVGTAYDAAREPGEDYYEMGLPRRVSYLISPEGQIAKSYDLAGQDLSEHAGVVLADLAALS